MKPMLSIASIAIAVLLLSSCITLPGHRIIIKEDNLYIHIEAPSKAIKNQIRFNAEQTELTYLPESAQIELNVKDVAGQHQLLIKSVSGTITYYYYLNSKRIDFGPEQQDWFAKQVPTLIEKTGLN